MKKTVYLFLTIMFFGLAFLSACSKEEPKLDSQDKADEQPVEEIKDDTTTEREEENTEVDKQNEEQVDKDSKNNDEQTEEETKDTDAEPQIVIENEAFRIYEPAPDSEVDNIFAVRGETNVIGTKIVYELEDGHFILNQGFFTVRQTESEWSKFEITINFDELSNDAGRIILYEENIETAEKQHELIIPVNHKK